MEYIYEHYIEWSDNSSGEEDYTDETAMMQAVLADTERVEEHVLISTDRSRVVKCSTTTRARGHLTLMDDYFAPDALFSDDFHRRFLMHKNVFDHLYHGVRSFDDYLILKKDAVGRIGFSGYQKCPATLQMLSYGMIADSWDE